MCAGKLAQLIKKELHSSKLPDHCLSPALGTMGPLATVRIIHVIVLRDGFSIADTSGYQRVWSGFFLFDLLKAAKS